ncbi:SWIM zinc finger family protein [Streptomyces sp. NPDC047072]|uniref:SWIM zinc finger family protein n=1 Tax=Streptomyces sp. NPDC047072 TaxID=3154809 RepID=UPI00340B7A94
MVPAGESSGTGPLDRGHPTASAAELSGIDPLDRRRPRDSTAAPSETTPTDQRTSTPPATGSKSAAETRRPFPAPNTASTEDRPSAAPGVRARDVRRLLAGAFEMPVDDVTPEEQTEADSEAAQRDPGVLPPAPTANPDTMLSPSSPSSPSRAPAPTPPPAPSRAASPSPTSSPSRAVSPFPTPSRAASPSPASSPSPSPTSPASPSPTSPPPASTPPPPPPPSPTTPHRPHSMAAPGRDSDLRRTFAAFPPRPSGTDGFAETWWGNAWVRALEEGALDAKRLARGRGYAAQGHVDAITVTPGLVLAYVQGSRPRPYRVQVRLRTLVDADWDRFLERAADRTGHIAALLDKEMPQSLAECGVPLLPGPGDLEPQCSCPDRGHPCKHAAALCYQTARLLDADPFVLLLLRGRGERELLDSLSRLSATRAARAAQDQEPAPLPGVRASEAVGDRRLPPLPAPLPLPAHPEQPPAYPAAPGGPDPFALDQLATDAAARAHALLATGRDPVGDLTLWQDAVRLAAARPGSGLTAGTRALYASLATATGRTPADLARAVAAWRQGGLEGLAVLEEPWDPPAGRFDRARPLLLAADLPVFRPWRNHLTHPHGHVQLRLGQDGLWYAYESEPGHDDWWPRGTPDLDPVGALTGLGTPTDL